MSKRGFLELIKKFGYTEKSLKTYQQHLRLSNLKADNSNNIHICWGAYFKCDNAVKYTSVFYSHSIQAYLIFSSYVYITLCILSETPAISENEVLRYWSYCK